MDADDPSLIWTSADPSIVEVKAGRITAKQVGTTTVTIASSDGNAQTEIRVTVKEAAPVLVERITVDRDDVTLNIGESVQIHADISPADADDPSLIWTSANPSIVEVKAGRITAKQVGTTSVTVASSDGNAKREIRVTVRNESVSETADEEQRADTGVSMNSWIYLTAALFAGGAIIWSYQRRRSSK